MSCRQVTDSHSTGWFHPASIHQEVERLQPLPDVVDDRPFLRCDAYRQNRTRFLIFPIDLEQGHPDQGRIVAAIYMAAANYCRAEP